MKIQSGSFCIESNGDFFYVNAVQRFATTIFGDTHQVYIGTNIGFFKNKPVLVSTNCTSLWKSICTDHGEY